MNDQTDAALAYRHGSTPRAAVLLVNLGTPDAPTTEAVRRYLAEFLWDPRVIEFPRLPWWLILHGVILRVRPARSARNYAKIWTEAGSPLLVYSRALAEGLQSRLASEGFGEVLVDLAMSYGNPSIPAALERLRAAGVQRLLLLPLYPQYSNTTTGSIFERVTRELARWRWLPELRIVNQYWEDAAWLDAVADSVAAHWEQHGRKHLLFSFHSIPKRYFTRGDPYHCFCQGTARRIAARLGLGDDQWSVGFQSRFGREEWLRPYVDELLLEYARGARRKVTVVCPGFATDCLETLEEIAMQNQEAFLEAGGEAFDYVPALNDSAAHVAAMAALVRRHAAGWPEFDPARDPERLAAERTEARAHALRLGAPD